MPERLIGQPAAQIFLARRSLPPVTLLHGPAHTGKKTVAYILMMRHSPETLDRMWVPMLTAETVQDVARAALLPPWGGSVKTIVVCLDGATVPVLTRLLKLLEEPPETARFILIASGEVLPTIRSRAERVPFGLLLEDDVVAVLEARGMDPAEAAKAAPLGGGQVRPAMEAHLVEQAARQDVIAALMAVSQANSSQLGQALHGWNDERTNLLVVWCCERISGQRKVFRTGDWLGLSPHFAAQLLERLGAAQVVPRTVTVQAALEMAIIGA